MAVGPGNFLFISTVWVRTYTRSNFVKTSWIMLRLCYNESMKLDKDKKIKEMVQYWIETAGQDAINHYAQYKMEQWYYTKGYEEVDDFYANHLNQIERASKK